MPAMVWRKAIGSKNIALDSQLPYWNAMETPLRSMIGSWLFVSLHFLGHILRLNLVNKNIFCSFLYTTKEVKFVVDLAYVKKRKRKKITILVSSISAVVVAVFVILSFLGRNLGSFIVNLNRSNVSLALSEKSNLEDSTSFLRIADIPTMDTYTYGMIDKDSEVDSEATDYLKGAQRNIKGEVTSLNYLKYTFFITNTGTTSATYDFSLNFLDNEDGSNVDNQAIKDIMRVKLYSNTDSDSHNAAIYANKGKNVKVVDGQETFNEYVSDTNKQLCTNFVDEDTVLKFKYENFKSGEQIRYTVLIWLEGSDPECTGTPASDTKVRLGIDINAYEYQE